MLEAMMLMCAIVSGLIGLLVVLVGVSTLGEARSDGDRVVAAGVMAAGTVLIVGVGASFMFAIEDEAARSEFAKHDASDHETIASLQAQLDGSSEVDADMCEQPATAPEPVIPELNHIPDPVPSAPVDLAAGLRACGEACYYGNGGKGMASFDIEHGCVCH